MLRIEVRDDGAVERAGVLVAVFVVSEDRESESTMMKTTMTRCSTAFRSSVLNLG